MKKFLPAPRLPGSVVGWLQSFVPKLEDELVRIEKKIPGKAPTMEEILAAVREDPETKDALYRYFKERMAKE